jgi:hypothetical protein
MKRRLQLARIYTKVMACCTVENLSLRPLGSELLPGAFQSSRRLRGLLCGDAAFRLFSFQIVTDGLK